MKSQLIDQKFSGSTTFKNNLPACKRVLTEGKENLIHNLNSNGMTNDRIASETKHKLNDDHEQRRLHILSSLEMTFGETTASFEANHEEGTFLNQHDRSDEIDVDDDDDYSSECSGDTVVANNYPPPPPENASMEEMNRYYWEVCYGEDAFLMMKKKALEDQGRLVALRSAPAKSCLSTKKTKHSKDFHSVTPRRLDSGTLHDTGIKEVSELSTPYDDCLSPDSAIKNQRKTQSAVKFGINSAAEFDSLQPITEFTPIPAIIVEKIFPVEMKETEKDLKERVFSRETAQNVAMLAEWDADFDRIVSQDDDDDDEYATKCQSQSNSKRRRKRTPSKNGRCPSHERRRDSTFFSRDPRSLLNESDKNEDESYHGLPLNVTINPNECSSPSTILGADDSNFICFIDDESLSTTDTSKSFTNRESLSASSACISPSSSKSSVTTTNLEFIGKETPNSARTSSSTILMAMHASGASIPSDSPQGATGDLRPNQLNYSPTSSMDRSDTSVTDIESLSLGLDILSYYTEQSFAETETNVFQMLLFILSNHPLQMLHVKCADLARWKKVAAEKSPTALDSRIRSSFIPITALSLVIDIEGDKSIYSFDSSWLQSILFFIKGENIDGSSCVRHNFECLLLNELKKIFEMAYSQTTCKNIPISMTFDEYCTIESSFKQLHSQATLDWSLIDFNMARESLKRLTQLASKVEWEVSESYKYLITCITKIASAMKNVTLMPSKLNRLKIHHKSKKSQTHEIMARIIALENDLILQNKRLNQSKSVKAMLSANLEMERSIPITAMIEELRNFIFPTPFTHNGEDFTFCFLNGSAEVAMKLTRDHKGAIEFGCFIKDRGASIQVLQAILLGNISTPLEGIHGPFPLRTCLTSLLLQNQSRHNACMMAIHLFFRVDLLLKSIRSLETDYSCAVHSENDESITLSVIAHEMQDLVRVAFVFDSILSNEYVVTTTPTDVKVTIVTIDKDQTHLSNSLQHKARSQLSLICHISPHIINIIVDQVMKEFRESRIPRPSSD